MFKGNPTIKEGFWFGWLVFLLPSYLPSFKKKVTVKSQNITLK